MYKYNRTVIEGRGLDLQGQPQADCGLITRALYSPGFNVHDVVQFQVALTSLGDLSLGETKLFAPATDSIGLEGHRCRLSVRL
jgi:hypothetical protein